MNGDKKYITEREKLIPLAVKHANFYTNSRKYKSTEQSSADWNREFHTEMERLWTESQK